MPDPLLQQNGAVAGGAPAILLLWRRWYDHRADAWLPAPPRQQCSQQRLAVDSVGLRSPPTPWHDDRRGINHVAFNSICVQQSVNPEAVEPGFLNDDDVDRSSREPFGS